MLSLQLSNIQYTIINSGLPWWLKWLTICLQCRRPGFDPWVGKIPWRRAWQPTPVFLLEESPWTQEPGGLQSMGSQRVRHDWAIKQSIINCSHFSVYYHIPMTHFITGSLYLLTTFTHFPYALTPTSGNHQPVLCIYEMGHLKKNSTCKWDAIVFVFLCLN